MSAMGAFVQQRANLRRSQEHQEHCEVQRVEQNDHRLVPAQHDEHAVHPVRDLRDARHGAPLRLDVVRVGVLAEPVSEVEGLGLRENDQGCREIKLL